MSRFKFLVLLFLMAITFVWPATAAAQDPSTCLPACFAYNLGSSDGDGTEMNPWFWDKVNDPDALLLRTAMLEAVEGRRSYGALQVTDCNDADPPQCTATLYIYDRRGNETSQDLGEVSVPDVGVPLPFFYILIFGALLAAVLIAVGLMVRHRGQQPA